MKKQRGNSFFQRILKILIILGLLSALMLVYIGYEKANDAEKATVPVSELYSHYVGDGAFPGMNFLDALVDDVAEDHPLLVRFYHLTGDDSAAVLIVNDLYLPEDGEVSTAIGRRFLVHRLRATYSEDRLFAIWRAAKGYPPAADGNDLTAFLKDIDLNNVPADFPLVNDVLSFLREIGLIGGENEPSSIE